MTNFNYRILVIGSGSIAKRHIANIKGLFQQAEVGCLSASGRTISTDETGAHRIYESIDEALQSNLAWAVVASPSTMHISHASCLLEKSIPVLIEKPLADSMHSIYTAWDTLAANEGLIEVAYCFRFMPSAIELKNLLEKRILGRIHSVLIDIGQYLPDWRPQTDYRNNVSARNELGGGVLLELSHELDYLTWMFGEFDTAYCVASTTGLLEVDVEDRVDAVLVRGDGLVANLHMDFLQRSPCRTCKIIGEYGSITWNLLNNNLTLSSSGVPEKVLYEDLNFERNNLFIDEVRRFVRVVEGELNPLVGLEQASYVIQLVQALKESSATGRSVDIGAFKL